MAGERILVVDDGADMRDFVVKYVLEPNGFQSQQARDGLEALEMIRADAPDLILLDLQMPRLDGVGLLKRMQEENYAIPVVLMTFYGSEEIAIEVFRLGVRDYVIKPFTEEELLRAIEGALLVARLRREHSDLTERLQAVTRDLQRYVRDLQGLNRVGKLIASQPDADTVLVRILEAGVFLMGAQYVSVYLLEGEGQLVQRAVKGAGDVQFMEQVVDDRVAWHALQSGQAVAGSPQLDPAGQARVVQMCAPLPAPDQAIGVLSALIPAEFASDQQLHLLSGLADYAAIGLALANR